MRDHQQALKMASVMRRGPLGALIFGLALLMQLLGPVLVSRAAVAIGDAAICAGSASGADADGSHSGGHPQHHEHCSFCQIACGATDLFGFLSVWIAIASPGESKLAFWALEPIRKARFGSDQHEVPRGPPGLI
jgi:hypothetical protein